MEGDLDGSRLENVLPTYKLGEDLGMTKEDGTPHSPPELASRVRGTRRKSSQILLSQENEPIMSVKSKGQ